MKNTSWTMLVILTIMIAVYRFPIAVEPAKSKEIIKADETHTTEEIQLQAWIPGFSTTCVAAKKIGRSFLVAPQPVWTNPPLWDQAKTVSYIAYIFWDNSDWEWRIADDNFTFVHTQNGATHTDTIIEYLTCNGHRWTASLLQDRRNKKDYFVHIPSATPAAPSPSPKPPPPPTGLCGPFPCVSLLPNDTEDNQCGSFGILPAYDIVNHNSRPGVVQYQVTMQQQGTRTTRVDTRTVRAGPDYKAFIGCSGDINTGQTVQYGPVLSITWK